MVILAISSASFAFPQIHMLQGSSTCNPKADICTYLKTVISDAPLGASYELKGTLTVTVASVTKPLSIHTTYDQTAMLWIQVQPSDTGMLPSAMTIGLTNLTVNSSTVVGLSGCDSVSYPSPLTPGDYTFAIQGNTQVARCSLTKN